MCALAFARDTGQKPYRKGWRQADLLQLMTGEGAEDLRVADDEAYVVQGGVAGVMHDHAASV